MDILHSSAVPLQLIGRIKRQLPVQFPDIAITPPLKLKWLRSRLTTLPPAALGPSYPTPWWMSEESEYALLNAQEQALLERSARSATNNRTRPTGFQPVRQQVPSEASNSPGRTSPFRSVPGVESFDDDYDPPFWEKNLRRGNIWTDPPRTIYTDEPPVSPRTIPAYPDEVSYFWLPET
ncbi:hypothetical protein B0T19DRAFT_456957 [Cercophora scortea]|uniref:Uncharacterized protein n=1 Tax=Cercophora scortea TaxID=314031 RepID=A0AAE0IW44_9PEZI|nr:hypothetical protein B0T19DRAFT_456957 [Cercophora scortea]